MEFGCYWSLFGCLNYVEWSYFNGKYNGIIVCGEALRAAGERSGDV